MLALVIFCLFDEKKQWQSKVGEEKEGKERTREVFSFIGSFSKWPPQLWVDQGKTQEPGT